MSVTATVEPLIDVIVLVHDQPQWVELCLQAVESFTKNKYRLIIVDNASVKTRTLEVLAAAYKRGHTVIRLAENKSFSNGVNVGVNAGKAKFIAILNSDAIVTENWDAALIQDASPKHVGLVGARSNYAAGPQGDPSFIGEPPYLVFVCVALRREVWTAVGPMDEETFDGFSSEDIDYSWRVKKAGYELKVGGAFVLHAGSRTLAATTGDAMARALNDQKYNARLIDKWGKDWFVTHTKTQGVGLVVSYHAEEWTRVKFMETLMGLRRSDNVGFRYLHISRAPIHMARQLAADFAVDQVGADWIVQVDDDATFPPDVLRRLLSHDKEIVTALAYQRKPPHFPCIFEVGEDGLLGKPMLGVENTGLRRVDVSGYHCSIMKTSVIRKMREAGIRQYYGGFDNKVGEDFAFSLNCKKVGVLIHCDTNLISGHIGSSILVDEKYVQAFNAGRMTP